MTRCEWKYVSTANMQLRLRGHSGAHRILKWYINSGISGIVNGSAAGGVGMPHVRSHNGEPWNEMADPERRVRDG